MFLTRISLVLFLFLAVDCSPPGIETRARRSLISPNCVSNRPCGRPKLTRKLLPPVNSIFEPFSFSGQSRENDGKKLSKPEHTRAKKAQQAESDKSIEILKSYNTIVQDDVPVLDSQDAVLYSGTSQLTNGGYLYALDARNDNGDLHGYPGFLAVERGELSLQSLRDTLNKAYYSPNRDAACQALAELMILDGAETENQISSNSRHLNSHTIGVFIPKTKEYSMIDQSPARWNPVFLRVNAAGFVSYKNGFYPVSNDLSHKFENVEDITHHYRSLNQDSVVCGFFHVSATQKQDIKSRWSNYSFQLQVIRLARMARQLIGMFVNDLESRMTFVHNSDSLIKKLKQLDQQLVGVRFRIASGDIVDFRKAEKQLKHVHRLLNLALMDIYRDPSGSESRADIVTRVDRLISAARPWLW